MARRMPGENILHVHLVSNGDCLLATTIARQIKHDFPGSRLTWAVSRKCAHILANNPFVDEIWPVDYGPQEDVYGAVWRRTRAEATRRTASGEFAHAFFTQIYPDNVDNYDGTTRPTIFRSYPGKISVPVAPVLQLSGEEVERVAQFAKRNNLADYANVVLFECDPASGQSSMTFAKALSISEEIAGRRGDTAFVLSSARPVRSAVRGVIDGSSLSMRENAELSKYCTLLLGCSSGITWLLTSDWAKRLPTIQFLNRQPSWYAFASVKYDHRYWGLPTAHILETGIEEPGQIVALVSRYLDQKTFEGLSEDVFMPSIDQVYDLYKRTEGGLDVSRVLRLFAERNPEVNFDKRSFYARLINDESRAEFFAMRRSIKRFGRLLRSLTQEARAIYRER